MNEGYKAGRGGRFDREEGGLRDLKENIGRMSKRKLERVCDGGGWIPILTISQDGTDLYREEVRDTFLWILDLPSRIAP